MEDILTVFQASKFCRVSPKTIINWIDAGHFEAYRTVVGHRRIKRGDLEVFMKKFLIILLKIKNSATGSRP